MKSAILITFLFLFLQCKSQDVIFNQSIYDTKINTDFEKLDTTKLVVDNIDSYNVKTYKILYIPTEDNNILEFTNSYNNIIYKKGWFILYKEFYKNFYIKRKLLFNKTDPNGQYYKQYEFDESGNLVKTTDYDKDYKTSFEQITRIAGKYGKKYGYQAKTGMNDVIEDKLLWNNDYVKIWRKEYKQKKYWLIGFNKPQYKNSDDKKCERLVVVVDDATGKVIKKEHYYDWYNRFLKDIEKLVK